MTVTRLLMLKNFQKNFTKTLQLRICPSHPETPAAAAERAARDRLATDPRRSLFASYEWVHLVLNGYTSFDLGTLRF